MNFLKSVLATLALLVALFRVCVDAQKNVRGGTGGSPNRTIRWVRGANPVRHRHLKSTMSMTSRSSSSNSGSSRTSSKSGSNNSGSKGSNSNSKSSNRGSTSGSKSMTMASGSKGSNNSGSKSNNSGSKGSNNSGSKGSNNSGSKGTNNSGSNNSGSKGSNNSGGSTGTSTSMSMSRSGPDSNPTDPCDPPPANQECATARFVTADDSTRGRTTCASVPPGGSSCNVNGNDFPITSPEVWYAIAGIGARVRFRVDADYDSQISVYEGNCGSLTCLAHNDDTGVVIGVSTVEVCLEAGRTYFISVHGFGQQSGRFTLTTTQVGGIGCLNPTNTECTSAQQLAVGGAATQGSTLGASIPQPGTQGSSCNIPDVGNSVITTPQVWYTIQGANIRVRFQVIADYDSQIAIYEGTCTALNCLARDDDTLGDLMVSTVEVCLEEGKTYFIAVYGFPGQQPSGTFSLVTTQIADPSCGIPANSECVTAELVNLEEESQGSTRLASTPQNGEPGRFCNIPGGDNFVISAPQVWYQFVGVANRVEFRVDANYDAQITLYEGNNCNALTCLDRNDDQTVGDTSTSTIQFCLLQGRTYFIAVDGFSQQSGTFTIETELLTTNGCTIPDNDVCGINNEVLDGEEKRRSNADATIDRNIPNCGGFVGGDVNGVWFMVQGTGAPLRINVQTDPNEAAWNMQFAVFTGACGNLQCEGGRQGNGFVDVDPTIVQPYRILVSGFSAGGRKLQAGQPDTGFFLLNAIIEPAVTSPPTVTPPTTSPPTMTTPPPTMTTPPPTMMTTPTTTPPTMMNTAVTMPPTLGNDACGQATVLMDLPVTQMHSNVGATPENVRACPDGGNDFQGGNVNGVWFSVQGAANQGLRINARVTDGTSFWNMQFAVFTGECNSLECVDGSRPAPGENGEVVVVPAAENNQRFLIVVAGQALDEAGSFQLTAQNVEPMEGDSCDRPIEITTGNDGNNGMEFSNMEAAFNENVPDCFEFDGDAGGKGVWFRVPVTQQDRQVPLKITVRAINNWPMQFAVFRGCANLDNQCEGGKQASGEATVDVPAGNNDLSDFYLILVSGRGATDTGTFTLTVETQNDKCANAIPVTLGQELRNAINPFANPDPNLPDSCGDLSQNYRDGRGVWFRVEMRDDQPLTEPLNIAVNTEIDGSPNEGGFDMQVAVFNTNNCDEVQDRCVDGKKRSSGTENINVPLGEPYLIYIAGQTKDTPGTFSLTVTEIVGNNPNLKNDRCDTDDPIVFAAEGTETKEGSNQFATIDSLGEVQNCGDFPGGDVRGVWFNAQSRAKAWTVRVEAKDGWEQGDVRFAVFIVDGDPNNPCDSRRCVAEPSNGEVIVPGQEKDFAYRIVVAGQEQSNTGNFEVTVAPSPEPEGEQQVSTTTPAPEPTKPTSGEREGDEGNQEGSTSNPTQPPTFKPTYPPTTTPTISPTDALNPGTPSPSPEPTKGPTVQPTISPTTSPTSPPTDVPTPTPTKSPSAAPTPNPKVSSSCAEITACDVCQNEGTAEVMSNVQCCWGEQVCKQAEIALGSNNLCCKGKQACEQATFSGDGGNTLQCDGEQVCKQADLTAFSSEITHCCSGEQACEETSFP